MLLLLLPTIAGLGVGYWAYSSSVREAKLQQVAIIVGLPSVDRVAIDMQSLFAPVAEEFSGAEAGLPNPGTSATLRVDNLGEVNQGARSLIRLVVQSSSGEVAERLLEALVERLASVVALRSTQSGADGRIATLQARIEALAALWDQLALSKSMPREGGISATDLRLPVHALASAAVVSALAVSEGELDSLHFNEAGGLKTEAPMGPPTAVPMSGASRWIRLPITAAVGAGFLILFLAFAFDGVKRARKAAAAARQSTGSIGEVSAANE